MNDVTARPNNLPLPPIIYLAAIAVSFFLGAFYPLPWFAQPLSGILSAIGTGDWTGLRDRVVFAACRPRCLRGAKARHREGGKGSPGAIREDLCGLRRACAAVDLGSCVAPLRFL